MPKTKVKLSPEDKKARQREYNRKYYEANKAKKIQAAKAQYERKKAAHKGLPITSQITPANQVVEVKLSPETSEIKSSLPPIVPPPPKVVSKPEWENKLFKAAAPEPVPVPNQVTTQEAKKPEPFIPTFKTCSLVKIKESGLVASVQFSKLTLAGEVVNVLVRVPGQAGTKYLQFKADELELYQPVISDQGKVYQVESIELTNEEPDTNEPVIILSDKPLPAVAGQVESIPLVVPVDVASKEPETVQEAIQLLNKVDSVEEMNSVSFIADDDDSEKEYDWLEDEDLDQRLYESGYDISELQNSDQVAHQEPAGLKIYQGGMEPIEEKEPETPGYVYLIIAAFCAAMISGIFLF